MLTIQNIHKLIGEVFGTGDDRWQITEVNDYETGFDIPYYTFDIQHLSGVQEVELVVWMGREDVYSAGYLLTNNLMDGEYFMDIDTIKNIDTFKIGLMLYAIKEYELFIDDQMKTQ